MPTPASESPDAASSPVPANRVWWAESYVSDPIAPGLKEPSEKFSPFGFPDSSLSVRQTPPPAAPTHTVQRDLSQVGVMASAVIRPEAAYSLPWRFSGGGQISD